MKYELTSESKVFNFSHTLYRIKALKNFSDVKKGNLGGWIEKVENLSQKGNCWVYGNAYVFDNARVGGNAYVFGNARVGGNALVWDNACVYDNASVYDDASVSGNAQVYGNAYIYGNALVLDNASVSGNARVCDNAWISGNARVYGDARVCEGALNAGEIIEETIITSMPSKNPKEKNKEVEIIRPKIINVILGLDLCEGNQ